MKLTLDNIGTTRNATGEDIRVGPGDPALRQSVKRGQGGHKRQRDRRHLSESDPDHPRGRPDDGCGP